MIEQSTFGQWVKARRKRLDLSREALALCVGCSLATIEKVETGERRSSRQIAELLAKCLRVPPADVASLVSFARGEVATLPTSLLTLVEPPARQASAPSLPSPPTAFIGREREVERVSALLRRGDIRLLTLLGPPGIGKTRLSLRVASGMTSDFSDGIFFVALATINNAGLAAWAIAEALGVRETSNRPLLDAIKRRLYDKKLLLVLDNFEQVIPAGQVVSELLSAAPGLKVLATSRTVLRVYGEHTFPVPPMSLPGTPSLPSLERLTEYEAIDLFVQRAQATHPAFRLTSENAQAVNQICHRLDGLPLAIELAAHRTKVLSPQMILARLGKRLDLLTEGALDLPARQQTLRGAIDWSYDLLNPAEQALFRCISVFSGATLSAIADCGLRIADFVPAIPHPSQSAIRNPQSAIVDGLTSLVDKSLVRRDDVQGEPWFSMLETVHEYAWDRLSLDERERENSLQRHAAYYLQLAEESETGLSGAQQAVWLDRLEREHDNFRAVLQRSLESGDIVTLARLAATLRRFWYLHAHMSEGREWLQKALAEGHGLPSELRAKVLHGTGTLAWAQGDNSAAGRYFSESLAIWRELGDKRGIANMLNNLGIVALPQGDYDTAHTMHTESLALYRELDEKWSIALALANLGLVALNRGEYREAEALLSDSLRLRREMGDRQGVAQSLNNLGIVMRCLGRDQEAYGLHTESLEMFEELGDRWSVALTHANLGFLALKEDPEQARLRFNSSLGLFIELDAKQGMTTCLEGLAAVAAATGRVEHAALLFGAAEESRNTLGMPLTHDRRDEYDSSRAATLEVLGATRFGQLWEDGRSISVEHASTIAIETDDPGS